MGSDNVGREVASLPIPSFLTAKQHFPGFFFTFFYAILKCLRPEHDCYAKFHILFYINQH